MSDGTGRIAGLGEKLSTTAAAAGIKQGKQAQLLDGAFRELCERILDDDILTPEEEQELLAVGEAVGIDNAVLNARYPDLTARVVVAGANDGRLPVVPDPQLMVKGDEEVHLELPATFLKEKVHREYRGGGSGIDPYRRRRARSYWRLQSQVGGYGNDDRTHRQRHHFGHGQEGGLSGIPRKTQECKYDKLVGMQTYPDAVQLSVSNRQTPSMYGVQSGPLSRPSSTLP